MGGTLRKSLIVFVAAIGLVALIASADEETAERSGGGGGGGDSDVFAVGEAVTLGDYEIVVHGVTNPLPASGILQPPAGSHWVAVDVEVKNLSDQAGTISTLVQFEVQDSSNQSYNVTLTDLSLPSLDGEAPPGGSRRGTMVFEVPDSATGLKLNFTGDLFASGSATVQLT